MNQRRSMLRLCIPRRRPLSTLLIISWVGLIITGWLFLIVPDIEKIKIFWTYIIITKDSLTKEAFKFPLNIYFVLFLLIAIIECLLCSRCFVSIISNLLATFQGHIYFSYKRKLKPSWRSYFPIGTQRWD